MLWLLIMFSQNIDLSPIFHDFHFFHIYIDIHVICIDFLQII